MNDRELIATITAAAVEAAADFVHDMLAGGPGSGRKCEVCNVSTKTNLCPKCSSAVDNYSKKHGVNTIRALEDVKEQYARKGNYFLNKYADTQYGDTMRPLTAANDGMVKPTYPKDHEAAMRVPKGGSSCASCEYLEGTDKCNNKYFIKWNGNNKLPIPADEYCSDWYEPAKKLEAATETSASDLTKGSLWNGIRITGFTGPEEEGLKAMLSRIPPELFYNVVEVKSAKELSAKHGRYIPETKTVLFNPKNFALRQRFGKGDGWMYHPELTVVHEIGHSIYEAFTPEQVKEWLELGGWQKGWKTGQAPMYKESRPGWGTSESKWSHVAGLKLPRHYSSRNMNEAFADCFAYYILGKAHQMEHRIKQFIDAFFKSKIHTYPSMSVQSPTKPYGTQNKN